MAVSGHPFLLLKAKDEIHISFVSRFIFAPELIFGVVDINHEVHFSVILRFSNLPENQ